MAIQPFAKRGAPPVWGWLLLVLLGHVTAGWSVAGAAEPALAISAQPVVMEGKGRALALAVSPNGKLLASAGYDHPGDDSKRHTIRIWDLATFKQVREIAVECDNINTLAFDPSSSRIALGDRSGLVSCLNVLTGDHGFTTPPSDSEIEAVVFARKGNIVISGSDKYRGWDSRTGKLLGEVSTPNDWPVRCLSLSRDETLLLAGGGGDGFILNATTLRPVQTFPGHQQGITAIAISGDKRRVATGSGDGAVKLWDAKTAKNLFTLPGHADGVNCLAFLDQDRHLVSGGNDGKLRIWNVASGEQEQAIDASTLAVDDLAVSPDGKLLINNDIIRIQARQIGAGEGGDAGDQPQAAPRTTSPMKKGKSAVRLQPAGELIGPGDEVTSLAFSPTGAFLIAGDHASAMTLWDLRTKQAKLRLGGHNPEEADFGLSKDVTSVALAPDGKHIASATHDGKVNLWDVRTGNLVRSLNDHQPLEIVRTVAFSPDGKLLASGSDDDTVILWDAAAGEAIAKLRTDPDSSGDIRSVAFSPDGRLLAAGGWSGKIQLWDIASKSLANTLEAHLGNVMSVAFSPDGKLLASAHWEETVVVWDLAAGQIRHQLKGHQKFVGSVAFAPDGKTLASRSGDGVVQIWDLAEGKSRTSWEVPTENESAIAFSPDGQWFAAGSGKTVRLWSVE